MNREKNRTNVPANKVAHTPRIWRPGIAARWSSPRATAKPTAAPAIVSPVPPPLSPVRSVSVLIPTWQGAQLKRSADKYAWSTFTYDFKPAQPGYVTFLARAWDDRGNAQPAIPAWNPLGYFWNGWHRVGVLVDA